MQHYTKSTTSQHVDLYS